MWYIFLESCEAGSGLGMKLCQMQKVSGSDKYLYGSSGNDFENSVSNLVGVSLV